MHGCVAAIMYELCRKKQKLELDLSHSKQAVVTNVSVPLTMIKDLQLKL